MWRHGVAHWCQWRDTFLGHVAPSLLGRAAMMSLGKLIKLSNCVSGLFVWSCQLCHTVWTLTLTHHGKSRSFICLLITLMYHTISHIVNHTARRVTWLFIWHSNRAHLSIPSVPFSVSIWCHLLPFRVHCRGPVRCWLHPLLALHYSFTAFPLTFDLSLIFIF